MVKRKAFYARLRKILKFRRPISLNGQLWREIYHFCNSNLSLFVNGVYYGQHLKQLLVSLTEKLRFGQRTKNGQARFPLRRDVAYFRPKIQCFFAKILKSANS